MLVLLAAALYFGVPAALHRLLQHTLAAQMHRAVSTGRITFNPLTLVARIDGLTVQSAEQGAQPLLAVDSLLLDVSIASLWHRAPVLDRVTIERPRLSLARNADGSYSIQDLIDAALASGSAPARFSLNNIEVRGGSLDFDDRPLRRKHEVRDISVGIPFLSSLPYQTAIKVIPHVLARVDGSQFSLTGTTTPFAAQRDTSLDIDIDALPLTQYLAYLPFNLRAEVTSGTVSAHAKLVFSEGDPQRHALWLSGQIAVDGLAVQRTSSADAISIAHAEAHVARLDVFDRRLVVDTLRVEHPSIGLRRAPSGTFDMLQPWIDVPAAVAQRADAPPAWRVDVEKAAVAKGALRVEDLAVAPAYRVAYGFDVDATDLSNAHAKRSHVRVAMTSEFGASAKADIELVPATLEASGHVVLDKLSLRRLYPYFASALNVDVQDGSLSVAADFAHMPDRAGDRFTVQAGEATLDGLKLVLHGSDAPLWRVPRVALTGVMVDVAARSIAIGGVRSRGGTLQLRRDADATLNLTHVLKPAAPAPGQAAVEGGWSIAVKDVALDHYAIDMDDEMQTPAVSMQLRDVALTADRISNARAAATNLAARASVAQGGSIAIEGVVVMQPFDARLNIDAQGIVLAPLQPYLDPHVDVTVTAGTASVKGLLALRQGPATSGTGGNHARWIGDVAINDFRAVDTPTKGDLARWKRVALTHVDVAIDPFRLDIGSVAADDYFARVILSRDATLNFVRLLKPLAPASAAAATTASQASPGTRAVSGESVRSIPVSIGRITLARGSVRYTDYYVRPNYTAMLTEVAGSVSSMSPTQSGVIDISAKLERSAPVSLQGTLNPFAPVLKLQLAAQAHDIDLPPLSPYAIKYAGYEITKGTLSFVATYKVEDRKLVADNKLVLNQLTFGARIDSPAATSLPVTFAVALLKDRNGVIDLDLPIAGSLDDPQFSIAGLVGKVLANLLQRVVTAPFAMLAALGGGQSEQLDHVAFAPGVARIADAADAKLDELAKGLAARPGVNVDIAGRVDAAADTEALRHAAVERMLRAEKSKALAASGSAAAEHGGAIVAADERLRYLTAAYKDAPIDDRPRNFLGMLKDVPAADMERALFEHATIGPAAMAELAQRRAQAVKAALVQRGVDAGRVFVVTSTQDPHDIAVSHARADLTLR